MTETIAQITEIFSSIQGEGTHLGERHIFLRFEKCNLHCDYCDESGKQSTELELHSVLEQIRKLEHDVGPHAYISLTGGEPLLYQHFLKELCPILYEEGYRFYLETNGTLSDPLQQVIRWIDVVSMDLKPSSVTKEKKFSDEHQRFLRIAKARETILKMTVSKDIDLPEFCELCTMIEDIHRDAVLVLQPVTVTVEGNRTELDPELMRLLLELQQIASGFLPNVRIIPRIHKLMNIR